MYNVVMFLGNISGVNQKMNGESPKKVPPVGPSLETHRLFLLNQKVTHGPHPAYYKIAFGLQLESVVGVSSICTK